MKDYLNAKVKHRESFRPFAPAVRESAAPEWFEITGRSPFMLRVVPARAAVRDRIPAVVHVDGSCRLQTVAENDNPGFYRIIRKFETLTGIPVLLNTSFNTAGKPIVETPADAVGCFASTEIDVLALGPFILSKRPLSNYAQPREGGDPGVI
jgi:carbamoyltransferase